MELAEMYVRAHKAADNRDPTANLRTEVKILDGDGETYTISDIVFDKDSKCFYIKISNEKVK